MDDSIIQHHFEEVFNALQDREYFEIFTKMRPAKYPRIKRTLVKILKQKRPVDPDESEFLRTYLEKIRNDDTTAPSSEASSSRPTRTFTEEVLERLQDQGSAKKGRKKEIRNRLLECRNCGKYVNEEFFKDHEMKCFAESDTTIYE
ncbi:unnamed protein product [Acanthoscelides obtectus]|uniref:Uncharacterized protein n=1 Tax=Acanthoscelides obtectus TaxID=200917 RepID=A0A9P0K5W4_ACAOB|nr:unnamed protein product [Acanthoscelides obtectus]CAK1626806.1 hypothetical protein AOBTE_LOCUS4088 [Acanthoscelides obtectus]